MDYGMDYGQSQPHAKFNCFKMHSQSKLNHFHKVVQSKCNSKLFIPENIDDRHKCFIATESNISEQKLQS